MTKLKLILAAGTASLVASPAFAHDGEHSHVTVVNILHGISSPSHALVGTVLGVASAVVVYKIAKKSRT